MKQYDSVWDQYKVAFQALRAADEAKAQAAEYQYAQAYEEGTQ